MRVERVIHSCYALVHIAKLDSKIIIQSYPFIPTFDKLMKLVITTSWIEWIWSLGQDRYLEIFKNIYCIIFHETYAVAICRGDSNKYPRCTLLELNKKNTSLLSDIILPHDEILYITKFLKTAKFLGTKTVVIMRVICRTGKSTLRWKLISVSVRQISNRLIIVCFFFICLHFSLQSIHKTGINLGKKYIHTCNVL